MSEMTPEEHASALIFGDRKWHTKAHVDLSQKFALGRWQEVVAAIRAAVSSALASGAERERALREELAARPTQWAYEQTCKALHAHTDAERAALAQLASVTAERDGMRAERDHYRSMATGLDRVRVEKDAEIARLKEAHAHDISEGNRHLADQLTTALVENARLRRATPLQPPSDAEREASEACVAAMRAFFAGTVSTNEYCRLRNKCEPLLRALDASRARPGQDEERAVEAAMKVIEGGFMPEYRDAATHATRLLYRAGLLLRDGGGA